MTKNAGEANPNYRHGGHTVNRPEYNSWRAMIMRCYDTKYVRYDRYGGRGIKVCDSWHDPLTGFAMFLKDMGKKSDPKLTLDRIDNDRGYYPDNCRWVDQKTQVRNSSKMKYITVDSITATPAEHVKRKGISLGLYYSRVKRGYTPEEAISKPNDGKAVVFAKRAANAIKKKPCKECGVPCKSIYAKYCSGHCYMADRGRETKLANMQSK